MAMTHGDVQIATSTQGGFMKGLKRTLGGESFFVNDFSSGTGGTVGVAAALPGDMSMVTLDGSTGGARAVRVVDRVRHLRDRRLQVGRRRDLLQR